MRSVLVGISTVLKSYVRSLHIDHDRKLPWRQNLEFARFDLAIGGRLAGRLAVVANADDYRAVGDTTATGEKRRRFGRDDATDGGSHRVRILGVDPLESGDQRFHKRIGSRLADVRTPGANVDNLGAGDVFYLCDRFQQVGPDCRRAAVQSFDVGLECSDNVVFDLVLAGTGEVGSDLGGDVGLEEDKTCHQSGEHARGAGLIYGRLQAGRSEEHTSELQ